MPKPTGDERQLPAESWSYMATRKYPRTAPPQSLKSAAKLTKPGPTPADLIHAIRIPGELPRRWRSVCPTGCRNLSERTTSPFVTPLVSNPVHEPVGRFDGLRRASHSTTTCCRNQLARPAIAESYYRPLLAVTAPPPRMDAAANACNRKVGRMTRVPHCTRKAHGP